MNKDDLIERLVTQLPLTKGQASAAIDTILLTVLTALVNGEKVTLRDFGTFAPAERKARNSRSPRTGEVIKIAAHKAVKFSTSEELKKAMNPDMTITHGRIPAERIPTEGK